MPIVFTIMFLTMPTSLVVYWTVSNLIAIAQQFVTNRLMCRRRAAGRPSGGRPQPKGQAMSVLDSQGHRLHHGVSPARWASTSTWPSRTPPIAPAGSVRRGRRCAAAAKGEVLDALQVIVNTVFRRGARGDRHYVVGALGFRRSKDAELGRWRSS